MKPTLSVRDFSIEYAARRGRVRAVRNVSFDVMPGEALALIGESGSGKTTLGLGIVQLLPATALIAGGAITYRRYASSKNGNGNGQAPHPPISSQEARHVGAADSSSPGTPKLERQIDVLKLRGNALRQFRWGECAMVFQSALNALNPVLRISEQFADTARAHGYLSGPRQGNELRERSQHLLSLVRLDAERVWRAFPHELSGGMRQRVLIALSLLLLPQLLILDEPTTALDILTQRNIMDVLKELRRELDFSLIFISHDLSLAAELADRVATVYAGKVVEIGDVFNIFNNPHHPYTIGMRFTYFHPFVSYDYNLRPGIGFKNDPEGEKGARGYNMPYVQKTADGKEINIKEWVDKMAEGTDIEAQKPYVQDVASFFNDNLPVVQMFERYLTDPIDTKTRVTGWLPADDPVYKNNQNNSPVARQFLSGSLKPSATNTAKEFKTSYPYVQPPKANYNLYSTDTVLLNGAVLGNFLYPPFTYYDVNEGKYLPFFAESWEIKTTK